MKKAATYPEIATALPHGNPRSGPLCHEGLVESCHALGDRLDFVLLRQEGRPEVESPWLLAKAGARHDADAGSVEEVEAVLSVGRNAVLGALIEPLLREMDLREGVHRSRGGVAGNARELVEAADQRLRTAPEGLEDAVELGFVRVVGGIAGLGRVDHEVAHHLAGEV